MKDKTIFIANMLLVIVILFGICTAIVIHGVDRSLWLDESFLASSLMNRNFIGLFAEGKLEYHQAAPIGWLYFEKILTYILHDGEKALRFGSLLSYLLVIVVLVFVQFSYRSKLPFAAAAAFANTPVVLLFSNIFKQYEFEAFISVLILFTFILKEKKILSVRLLIPLWMIFLWFSNSACFIEGGFVLSTLYYSLIKKDKILLKETIFICGFIILSFCIYFFMWANVATDVSVMQEYWGIRSRFFSFNIFDGNVLEKSKELLEMVFYAKDYQKLSLIFFISGIYLFVSRGDKCSVGICFAILLTIIASAFHYYAIEIRLCLFLYPLIFFASVRTLELVYISKSKQRKAFLVILCLCYVLFANGVNTFSNKYLIIFPHDEIKPSIGYLNQKLTKDEKIYVYKQTVPAFEFINGYGNNSFGQLGNNVIFGQSSSYEDDTYQEEMKEIISFPRWYLVFSHDDLFQISDLLNSLYHYGFLELVSYEYETPLYYFALEKNDSKLKYEFETTKKTATGDMCYATIRVKNVGESFLSEPYNKTYLTSEKGDLYEFSDYVPSNGYIDITVSYKKGENPTYTLKKQYGDIARKEFVEPGSCW